MVTKVNELTAQVGVSVGGVETTLEDAVNMGVSLETTRILTSADAGELLRTEAAAAFTVPNTLPEGFRCWFAQWAAGVVTITAGAGSTKRAGPAATAAQYAVLELLVVKNADGVSAEYVTSIRPTA